MEINDDSQDDVEYIQHLREVFDSCTINNSETINQTGAQKLCTKLTIQDKSERLIELLFQDSKSEVTFNEFKEGFISVLADSPLPHLKNSENLLDLLSDLDESSDEDEQSPKLVRGTKRYGRRSKPSFDEDEPTAQRSKLAGTPPGVVPASPPAAKARSDATFDLFSTSSRHSSSPPVELFEANARRGSSPSHHPPPTAVSPDLGTQEGQLREIWRELGVGSDGFLDMHELGLVCQHTGMEDMNDEELLHLFERLDEDRDGRVSFAEFLAGLTQHATPSGTPQLRGISPASGVAPPLLPPPRSAFSAQDLQKVSTLSQKSRLRQSVSTGSLDTDAANTAPPVAPPHMGASGLFTELDPQQTGQCRVVDVLSLWSRLGLPEPDALAALESLEYDTTADGRLPLAELSAILDERLWHRCAENGGVVQRAALASYRAEVKFLREHIDSIELERAKLATDLGESQKRVGSLFHDTEERAATVQRQASLRVHQADERATEQLRQQQTTFDAQLDALRSQLAAERERRLAGEERWRDEVAALRDSLATLEKERSLMREELVSTLATLSDAERANERLQNDLAAALDKQKKITDMEGSRETMAEEQLTLATQRAARLDAENKELKDRCDETSAEVELLRHQLRSRPHRRTSSRRGEGGASRTGSVLSKYTGRPKVQKRTPKSDDDDDDDASTDVEVDAQHVETATQIMLESETLRQIQSATSGLEADKRNLDAQVVALDERCTSLGAQNASLESQLAQLTEQVNTLEAEKGAAERENRELSLKLRSLERECDLGRGDRATLESVKMTLDERARTLEHEKDALDERHRALEEAHRTLEEANRRLREDLDALAKSSRAEKEQLASDYEAMQEKLLTDLRRRLEVERVEREKSLTDQFANTKITLEEEQLERVRAIRAQFETERSQLVALYTSQIEAGERERERRVDSAAELMRREKDEEIARLREQLRRDYELKLDDERTRLASAHETELLRAQKADFEARLDAQRADLEERHSRDRRRHIETEEAERLALVDKYRAQLEAHERVIEVEGESGLRGRLRDDFYRLLAERTEQTTRLADDAELRRLEEDFLQEKAALRADLAAERDRLEADYSSQIDALLERSETEAERAQADLKAELQRRFAAEIGDLKRRHATDLKRLANENGQLHTQMESLRSQHASDIDALRTSLTSQYGTLDSQAALRATVERLEGECSQLIAQRSAAEREADRLQSRLADLEASHADRHAERQRLQAAERAEAERAARRAEQHFADEKTRWSNERSALEQRVEAAEDRALRAHASLTVVQAQLDRTQTDCDERLRATVAYATHETTRAELRDAVAKAESLERQLVAAGTTSDRLILEARGAAKRELESISAERDDLVAQLERARSAVDAARNEYRSQLASTTRSGQLCSQLYVENAQLMQALQITEQRQKDAERASARAADKCDDFGRLVDGLVQVAVHSVC